jgi:glyoxylase-like metal-dependent hydrolase (beta-lactamase superfamily II)
MAKTNVVTLDLNFQGSPQAIASYLIRHSEGAVLIDCGPSSTTGALQAGLKASGLSAAHVTHVLLTHIHLDHAGAAGWWAAQGAQIIVHPVGAPHMLNPEKLLASATRIYGEKMDTLWGEFRPVPQNRLTIPRPDEDIAVGNLRFRPVDTPGHAEHHYAYVFEDILFSGDIGGVRIPGYRYLRVPMPPPELNFEKWRDSILRLRREKVKRIGPTHFGLFDDPEWQLQVVQDGLDAAEHWLEREMPGNPPIEQLRQEFAAWMTEEGRRQGLSADVVEAYDLANPTGMSADGLLRYWRKFRTPA